MNQSDDGYLIALGQGGDHLKSLPLAAGLCIMLSRDVEGAVDIAVAGKERRKCELWQSAFGEHIRCDCEWRQAEVYGEGLVELRTCYQAEVTAKEQDADGTKSGPDIHLKAQRNGH